ncbi:MAG: hypothetical protein RBS40_15420 [Rhodocyclaceae bacterium]|jgi:hypothetical protein|nr:hypothetical protein [Rhodocyclaceae bacterium]
MFLPAPVYEALPVLYTTKGVVAIHLSGYNPAVIGFSTLLFAASALITRMRRQYRRELAAQGFQRRRYA